MSHESVRFTIFVIFYFSLLCVFKCLFKLPPVRMQSHNGCISLSPLCVFKCVLNVPASEEVKSHWLHLFDFSPLCDFKCVLEWSVREDA